MQHGCGRPGDPPGRPGQAVLAVVHRQHDGRPTLARAGARRGLDRDTRNAHDSLGAGWPAVQMHGSRVRLRTADSDGDFVQGILTRGQYEIIET